MGSWIVAMFRTIVFCCKTCVLKTCISEGPQLRTSLYSESRNAWTSQKPILLIDFLCSSAHSVQSTCSTSNSVDSHVFTCVLCRRINFSCRPFARECVIAFPCLSVLAHSLCNQWQTKKNAELKGRMQFVGGGTAATRIPPAPFIILKQARGQKRAGREAPAGTPSFFLIL